MINNISRIFIIAIFIFIMGCNESTKLKASPEVEFAKATITSLVWGDDDVVDKIDFETLSQFGENIGVIYLQLPNDEKNAFRKSFVAQFAAGFQSTGASVENFKNWRVKSDDSTRTIVIADAPKGSLKIIISKRNGNMKLSALE